jgi:hypothetical protein
MNCESCGRQSLTGEQRCPDCAPMLQVWPTSTFLQRRREYLREHENNEQQEGGAGR